MCGEHFGGHEIGRMGIPTGENTSAMCCKACELEQGAKAAATCKAFGHEVTERWNMRRKSSHCDDGRLQLTGTFDTSAPPDERYCAVCFVDLDVS